MAKRPDSGSSQAGDRAPRFRAPAFICPYCKAYSHQHWFALAAENIQSPPVQIVINNFELLSDHSLTLDYSIANKKTVSLNSKEIELIRGSSALVKRALMVGPTTHHVINCYLSECVSCHRIAIWISEKMCVPLVNSEIPDPNPDLPSDIQDDYIEAASIFHLSPRGAAALLRLCIEKLCINVTGKRDNLNNMIGDMVSKGLDERIKMALDTVRVIGNETVHPGEIDLRDDLETARLLFELVNLIANRMITEDRMIADVYNKIPSDKISGIDQRDKRSHDRRIKSD